MIILIYIGIILFCYGIYNLLSYYSVLPTVSANRSIKKQQRVCNNALGVELSRKIAEEWDLEWKGNDRLSKILNYNKIYYSATVYCVSLVLMALCSLFLCLPLLFWNKGLFAGIYVGVLLYVSSDSLLLIYRYRKGEPEQRNDMPQKKKNIVWARKWVRLLPGVFFLCQTLLIFLLLT